MKKIIDYVRVLNPVNERKDLDSAISQLNDELVEFTIPTLKELQSVFAGHSFKSSFMQTVIRRMRSQSDFAGNPIDALTRAAETIESNCDLLRVEAKRLFSFQFTRENLTYRRVNLMRYVESAHFFVRYVRKLLLVVVAEEALAVGGATPMGWTKGELSWIGDNLDNFVGLYPSMILPESKLKQTLNSVSDATISEDTYDTAVQSLGEKGLDPMRLAHFSPTNNWFFDMGKTLAEWKVKRYKNAKEEQVALQLRLQEYRELLQDGNATPKLQQLIKHTEERISKLDYQIHRIEERHQY